MLDEKDKSVIQEGYRDFLRCRGFQPRFGQKNMIAEIAKVLSHKDPNKRLAVIEAGTGTGKTIAYLIAALPLARAQKKTLIVSTGTIALQEQLVKKDLPDLLSNCGWDFSYTLMKGRGRYACNLRMHNYLAELSTSKGDALFLFDDEKVLEDPVTADLYTELWEAMENGTWDGDRDTWKSHIDEFHWRPLTVDRRQCAGRNCRFVKECAFFRARSELEVSDCIVVNHDLVMADFSLGGGIILPPLEESIYVFDEAHRLCETAVRHFGADCHIKSSCNWLEKVNRQCKAQAGMNETGSELVELLSIVAEQAQNVLNLLKESHPICEQYLSKIHVTGEEKTYRFSHGNVEDDLRLLSIQIKKTLGDWLKQVEALNNLLKDMLTNRNGQAAVENIENLFQIVGQWLGRAKKMTVLWDKLSRDIRAESIPLARWVSSLTAANRREEISLSAYPIVASEPLFKHLWGKPFGIVLTSATLRSLGNFKTIQRDIGIPEGASYFAFEGAFDYARSAVIRIPKCAVDGNDIAAHTNYIISSLDVLIEGMGGSLVLFASRKQMQEVYNQISTELRRDVLMQGQFSHSEIRRIHVKRVDSDSRSIIFGLATFSEGIDLPGDYCRHVVIAKLPFSVPNEPQHEALCEWIESEGGNAFFDISLPTASLRLNQACGRLLRNETDTGTVTVLDRRLVSKRYGSQLLDSLPPFARQLNTNL